MFFAKERHGASQIPSESLRNTFHNLHQLSRTWHILHENLIDHEEVLTFVLGVHRNHIEHRNASKNANAMANYEAIEFLLSRNQIWRRWASNYTIRTQIRINLFFNLASQYDNRTNIEIASNSKKIAEATLKDSSSMITIAAMTMLFLPGTFVSVSVFLSTSSLAFLTRAKAIFSMTFFSSSADASGKPTLTVLPEWWYFPVATIPLTILVFGCWRLWQRKREGSKAPLESTARISSLTIKESHNA